MNNFLCMIIHFILYITHYSFFVVGGVDVLISEENGGLYRNQVETASCHRVLDSCDVLKFYVKHDNARPHTSRNTTRVAVHAVQKCSATLAARPCVLRLSSLLKMKERLKGRHFNSDDAVKTVIWSWCRQQPTDFFSNGFARLVTRCRTCLERD